MKRNEKILIAVIVVPLVLMAARFLVGGSEDIWRCEDGQWVTQGSPRVEQPTTGCGPVIPIFTQDEAEALAAAEWGTCGDDLCDKMIVAIMEYENTNIIIVTQEGHRDDSVYASRYEAPVGYDPAIGSWYVGVTDLLWKCQPERGHQGWSNELCF